MTTKQLLLWAIEASKEEAKEENKKQDNKLKECIFLVLEKQPFLALIPHNAGDIATVYALANEYPLYRLEDLFQGVKHEP